MTPALGIIMLDTSFLRPSGDAGNVLSWPFPVIIERVTGASAKPVITGRCTDVQPFVDAGYRLIAQDATAVITTCGFLVRHQKALQAALAVPVLTSTLTQFVRLQADLGSAQRVAILTVDAGSLDAQVRDVVGIPDSALAFTLPRTSHFISAILDESVALDTISARQEWVGLAETCMRQHADIGLWLFECANMPLYAKAISHATGLPVYDALAMGRDLFMSTAVPQ